MIGSTITQVPPKITDEGVKRIAAMKSITRLVLSRTAVTDEGAKALATLDKLIVLNVADTKVSAETVKELQKLLPKCKITR